MSHYCCTPRLYQYIGSANNIEIGWLKPVTVCCFAVGGGGTGGGTALELLHSYHLLLSLITGILFYFVQKVLK